MSDGTVFRSGTIANMGTITNLTELGCSKIGDNYAPGASGTGYIDNIKFYTASGVSGKVTQSDGITPIPGSIVEARGTGVVKSSSTADVNGNYSLSLATGTYDVKVSSTWYQSKSTQTVNVSTSQITTVNFIAEIK